MAAKDYILAVTPLTNTVWICKTSKRDKNAMTDDRVKVDESHFIGIILEWIHNKLEENSDTLKITNDGKVVAELKIDRVALGLAPAPPKPKAKPSNLKNKPKTAKDVAQILAKGNSEPNDNRSVAKQAE